MTAALDYTSHFDGSLRIDRVLSLPVPHEDAVTAAVAGIMALGLPHASTTQIRHCQADRATRLGRSERLRLSRHRDGRILASDCQGDCLGHREWLDSEVQRRRRQADSESLALSRSSESDSEGRRVPPPARPDRPLSPITDSVRARLWPGLSGSPGRTRGLTT